MSGQAVMCITNSQAGTTDAEADVLLSALGAAIRFEFRDAALRPPLPSSGRRLAAVAGWRFCETMTAAINLQPPVSQPVLSKAVFGMESRNADG
jgi:hypothetical protein